MIVYFFYFFVNSGSESEGWGDQLIYRLLTSTTSARKSRHNLPSRRKLLPVIAGKK